MERFSLSIESLQQLGLNVDQKNTSFMISIHKL